MRKIIKTLTLVFLTLLIITCASSIDRKCSGGRCDLHNIEHRITYSQKGSRSEAQHGYLYINGKQVPDVFLLLQCDNAIYKFYQRKHLWGKDGYFLTDNELKNISVSEKEISGEQIASGWYEGNEKLKGTPSAWIYAEWENGSGFASPEFLEVMADFLKLKPVVRMKVSAFSE